MSLSRFVPFVFVFVSLSVIAEGAFAQGVSASTLVLEAGGISARQPQHATVGAGTVSIQARRATMHTAFSASGLLLASPDSSTAAQGTLGAEFALPAIPSLRLEISGTATSFGALSSNEGTSRDGYLRPQLVRPTFGFFGTFGAGTVTRNGAGQHALAWDIGAWGRRGIFTGALALRRSFTNDSLLVEASNIFLSRNARHYTLQDIQGTLVAQFSRFELITAAASRNGIGATTGRNNALFVSLTTAIRPRFSFVLNGGKQLAEPLSGVPSATLFGASLRLHLIGINRIKRASHVEINPRVTEFDTRIDRHATGGATVTVRVDAPAASTVELSGSFNEWKNLPMTRTGNAYELTVELPSGTHRLAVRVNGGDWKAPAGLARAKDGLGGEVGIVVVP